MSTNSPRFKVRLGIFVALGLLIFAIAIFLIGRQKNLFNPVFNLTTAFYNVSGLQVGNNVRFSGINIGTVDKIEIVNDSTVRVDMIIKKNIQGFIKTDCQVAIGSEGIIGDRILTISQSTSSAQPVKDGSFLLSVEPVEVDAIISNLFLTSVQLAEIMTSINQGGGTLGRLINDSTISENISQTIINLKKSSRGLDQNMEAAKSNFLLRGFFKKKAKAAEEKKGDATKEKK